MQIITPEVAPIAALIQKMKSPMTVKTGIPARLVRYSIENVGINGIRTPQKKEEKPWFFVSIRCAA